MNYSLMFYPWCKSSGWGVGEGVDREKDKESSKCIMHRRVYMSGLLLQKVFFFFCFPHHPPSALLCQHQLSENSQGPTNLL